MKYYKGEYVENIIKYSDWLCTINPEVHKYIGRVFLKCGYEQEGLYFLKQAEDYFTTILNFIIFLPNITLAKKETENTIKYIGKCLGVLPGYFPAINLQRKLKSDC